MASNVWQWSCSASTTYDLEWASGVTYRDVRLQEEIEQSRYVFGSGVSLSPAAFAAFHRELFERY
jgi:glycyl-tRNA synthetase alpha subunit